MKLIKTARYVVWFLFVIYIASNWYFGWNKHPQSNLEEKYDTVMAILFWIAVFLYLSPLHRLYIKAVYRMENPKRKHYLVSLTYKDKHQTFEFVRKLEFASQTIGENFLRKTRVTAGKYMIDRIRSQKKKLYNGTIIINSIEYLGEE